MNGHRLFSTDSPKAIKAEAYGYLNAIHYLAPSTMGGVGNLCSHASEGCIALCLGHYSGQASMVADLEHGDNPTRKSRRDKAVLFMRERKAYIAALDKDITRLEHRAAKLGKLLCVRLNGSSDIAWERVAPQLFANHPTVQFVDYTKNPSRMTANLPSNYWLTFSRSETNEAHCVTVLNRGYNVAVVFAGDKPDMWLTFPTIDGDTHDLRHLDQRGGYVVALTPKGRKAKHDTSGFVVRY